MKSFCVYFVLLVLTSSCWKSDRPEISFPAETRSGLNTFGCYIDGSPFVPSTTLFGNVRPISVYYNHDSTQYYPAGFLSINGIDARYELDVAGNVLIQKLQVFGEGNYPISHVFNCIDDYRCDGGGYLNAKESKNYFIDTGRLTITRLDTINKIISGRFSFVAKDTLGNAREIKNGIFDTKYVGP